MNGTLTICVLYGFLRERLDVTSNGRSKDIRPVQANVVYYYLNRAEVRAGWLKNASKKDASGGFMAPTQVLLDTSFILSLVKQHRDPWAEVKTVIPGKAKVQTLDLVKYELEHLARTGPSTTASWARTSLELMSKKNHVIVEHKPGPSNVDAALMAHALAEREVTAIATVDREMRRVMKANGIPAIWPKARHGLLSSGF